MWLHYWIQSPEIHNDMIFYRHILENNVFWDYLQNLSNKVLFWPQIRIQRLKIRRNTMVSEKVLDLFFVWLCNFFVLLCYWKNNYFFIFHLESAISWLQENANTLRFRYNCKQERAAFALASTHLKRSAFAFSCNLVSGHSTVLYNIFGHHFLTEITPNIIE